MKDNMDDKHNDCCGDEDLSNYITQVVTDIGNPLISSDIVNKFSKVSQSSYKIGNKALRCKMASVSNPEGVSCEEYSQFAFHVIKYLSYIKDYPKPELQELIDSGKMVNFKPIKEGRKLVVFDLDETLVHCIYNDPDIHDADVFLDIKMINGKTANTGFNIRPYWKELMDEIKEKWEIVVFTASCKNYADAILDYMDPDNEYFQRRLYRETCYKTEDGVYIKDLRVFEEWDLKDIILVDNAVYSFGFQLDNGIPIFPYIQGKDDKQLLYLKDYLLFIEEEHTIEDLKKIFQMRNLLSFDIENLQEIYNPEGEDEDESTDDILDLLLKNGDFLQQVSKSPSFGNGKFLHHGRHSSSGKFAKQISEEESKKLSPDITPDTIHKSYSNNDAFNEPFELNEGAALGDIMQKNLDAFLLGDEPQQRSQQNRLTMPHNHINDMLQKNEHFNHSGELTNSLIEGHTNPENHKNACTPTISAKKRTKRKKYRHSKGSKQVASAITENTKLEEEEPCKQIPFFKKNSSGGLDDDQSFEESPSNQHVSPFINNGRQYTFKRSEHFSKSEKFINKRNPSPLEDEPQSSLVKTTSKGYQNRRTSKSSSSSDLDRYDDNCGSTATNTIIPKYSFNSNESNPTDQPKGEKYICSSIDNIVEADKDEEFSPDIRRNDDRRDSLEERRDSLNEELDHIQAYFNQAPTSLAKRHSTLTTNECGKIPTKLKRKSKNKKPKITLQKCECPEDVS